MQSVQISDEHIWRGGSDAVPKTIAAYPPLKRMEREPFVFFYTPGDTFAESHIDGLAAERGGVLQLLKGKIAPSFCGKVAFYLFPDRVTKFGYTLHHGAGWATGRAIVEVFNEHEQLDATHELVHIVASSIGNPPALFREGLAVALQRDAKWDGYSVDAWTRDLKRRNMLMPERQLFVLTDIGPEQTLPAITYPEAGSFMKYLSERFGLDAVLRAYGQLKSADDPHWIAENETKFEHIFGRSVDRAAAEWLAAIDVSTAEPIPAERIEAIRKKINAR